MPRNLASSTKLSLERAFATSSASSIATRATGALALLLFIGTAQAQQGCTPYEPTEAGQVIPSTWSKQFEKDKYQFTVPADPGGGYVIARVQTTAPSRAQLRIVPPSGQGIVARNAPDGLGPSPQMLEVAFEVAPSTTFDVELSESNVTRTNDFPVAYTWSWKFISRVDCYEPNNARPSDWPAVVAAAKTIPVNQVLEAYSLAGHLTYMITGADANNFDWYTFTLDAPTQIWLATLEIPSNQRIRVRLFNSRGGVVGDKVPPVGETGVVGPTLLQPGRYYVDLGPVVRGQGKVAPSEGDAMPDHFDRPYRFIVSTTAPK